MSGGERLPVAILAGGLATRMYPLTETVPKALLDVGGQPFILHQLRLLRANGVERVVLCVGHLGHMIQAALAKQSLGLELHFSYDGPRLLGTAGALKKARPLLGASFFVLYGDSYLTCRFESVQEAFVMSGRKALMTVFRNDGQWDASNVEFDAGRIVAYDKSSPRPTMHHIDYGLGVMSSAALDMVPPGEPFDLAHLYQHLLQEGQLAGFEVMERFYEIGSSAGLEETRALLA